MNDLLFTLVFVLPLSALTLYATMGLVFAIVECFYGDE